jgi:hypothetical protein
MAGRVWTLELRAPSVIDRRSLQPVPAWLTMNGREHWREKANRVKRWRDITWWVASAAKLPNGNVVRARIDIELIFSAPARRDPPNWAPTGKAIVDTLTAGTKRHPGYGFLPDDSPRFLHCQECPHITISPDRCKADAFGPVGLVVVTITEQEP